LYISRNVKRNITEFSTFNSPIVSDKFENNKLSYNRYFFSSIYLIIFRFSRFP